MPVLSFLIEFSILLRLMTSPPACNQPGLAPRAICPSNICQALLDTYRYRFLSAEIRANFSSVRALALPRAWRLRNWDNDIHSKGLRMSRV